MNLVPLVVAAPTSLIKKERRSALKTPFVIASASIAVSATLRTEVVLVVLRRVFRLENLPFLRLRVGMVGWLSHAGDKAAEYGLHRT